jgi:hypothetical protein
MRLPMLDDEHAPFYTVGQVAAMLAVQHALLRRIDDQRVVTPQRFTGRPAPVQPPRHRTRPAAPGCPLLTKGHQCRPGLP